MIRAIVLSCMIGFAAINASAAEIVEIQLPALAGTYGSESMPCGGHRSASFQLDRLPDTIYGVWIRMSGTVVVGQEYCDFSGWPPPYTEAEGMLFNPAMKDSLHSAGWGVFFTTPDESSAFEYQVQFLPGSGATWEYLESGRGDVSVYSGAGSPFVECRMLVCPVATINQAVLVIEADFPIATGESSWGAIKSLYR
jgi:hypothetical protein